MLFFIIRRQFRLARLGGTAGGAVQIDRRRPLLLGRRFLRLS